MIVSEILPDADATGRIEMDSDDEEVQQAVAPGNLAERRRAQKARFDAWLISDAAKEVRDPRTKEQKINDAKDEELSMEFLVSKQGAQIIKHPRQYQRELYERAVKQNTIAVLDTGSGKTMIAVLLLRTIIDQELEDRAAGKAPRISFFLVASITLVYQQFAVLEKNVDHKVARVSGADSTDNWHKAKWIKLFSEHKVIVVTADVLHQCLAHSYITMKQINLLIFDEAHHAKKNHAYARIIKDFYMTEEDTCLPRIFGMTASPIDARDDVMHAARRLETLLHCQIATTTDMSLTDNIKKPTEYVIKYAPLAHDVLETPFLSTLRACFDDSPLFDRHFTACREIARHLGRWCADTYLANALSKKALPKYEKELELKHYHATTHAGKQIYQLDEKIAELRRVVDFVDREQCHYVSLSDDDISTKVLELKRYLSIEFERHPTLRCIVFVEKRDTARLLNAVFTTFQLRFMKTGCLIGANNNILGHDNVTFRQQVLTLLKFRKGEINCLFATSVAEEGLDVPDCNLVIRFDMYRTMIQYVQSRGRARRENSKFIHMLEHGSLSDQHTLGEVRQQEQAMRRFCLDLPEDRRLHGNEDQLEELMAYEKVMRVYTEPSTGAKLTYGNALVCLANFVSAVPCDTHEYMHPTYVLSAQGSKFVAEVLLPGNAPIKSVIGRPCTKKSLAKRSAAFEACIQLRKKDYIDGHLLPVYQKKLPAMRNALLAKGMDQTNMYTMRTNPSCWAETRGSVPSELYVNVVDFPDGLEYSHQPILFLTRTPMPQFPAFPIYLNDGRASMVISRQLSGTLQVRDHMLAQLNAFTFRIFKDVFSKTYEEDGPKLPYWLAPAVFSRGASSSDAASFIDWKMLLDVHDHDEYEWTPATPASSLVGRFLVDKWDGAKKFYCTSIRSEMTPQDPVPDDAAKAKWGANILDYSISLYKNARAKAVWTKDQPVMEAEKILARRNMLAAPDRKEKNLRKKALLCPEPLRISVLKPAMATSCFVWPAVIHRIESYLIALEACAKVGVECEPSIALAAVTKDSENSGEHGNEQIKFQRGMGENYERLEFIGDTFLKTATTMATYILNPLDNEFEFHCKRMPMLCNLNLFSTMQALGLHEYVRSIAFSRRLWYPEGLKLLEGKGVNKQEETSVVKHSLGKKTLADVGEALIGAAFVSHNKPGERWQPSQWDNAVRTVTTVVNQNGHTMKNWIDYVTAYEKPSYQTGEVSASQRDLAEKVMLDYPYKFTYPRLLRSAFIHSSESRLSEGIPSYERLEFLGDAMLDMASITHLFYRHPDKDPQWLTEHKMAMVSNKFLGAVSVNMGFHKHLRYETSVMQRQIDYYVSELQEAKLLAGEARDYWTTVSDPPKCLPDMVEAFVGAMFIDSNFDYNVVQDFFDRKIKWYFEDMSIYDSFANNHPCTHLHNLLDTTYGCQDYRLMARELPAIDGADRQDIVAAVMIHDEIVAHSKGKSGRYARLRAAQKAIETVNGLAPYEFRARFGCNCHLVKSDATEEQSQHGDCSV